MNDIPLTGTSAVWVALIIAATKGIDSLIRLAKDRRSGKREKVNVAETVQDMAIEQMKELRIDLTATRREVGELRQQVSLLRQDLTVTRNLLVANNIPVPKLRSV